MEDDPIDNLVGGSLGHLGRPEIQLKKYILFLAIGFLSPIQSWFIETQKFNNYKLIKRDLLNCSFNKSCWAHISEKVYEILAQIECGGCIRGSGNKSFYLTLRINPINLSGSIRKK